jgi:hypothetical protein
MKEKRSIKMFDEWQPLASSNLSAVRYNADERVLEVEFTSGTQYSYADVGPETYKDLLSADSHGKFFHAHIRSSFSYEKIL